MVLLAAEGEAVAAICGSRRTDFDLLLWQRTALGATIRWSMAMASKANDPAELWRAMLGEMEKGFNAFANQTRASSEFEKVVEQVGGASAGAQKQLGEWMERYLASMNLPSREQLTGFGERLQAIETQLQDITALLRQLQSTPAATVAEPAAAAKPPRGRRSPSPQPAPK
jgi:hypothetical protein